MLISCCWAWSCSDLQSNIRAFILTPSIFGSTSVFLTVSVFFQGAVGTSSRSSSSFTPCWGCRTPSRCPQPVYMTTCNCHSGPTLARHEVSPSSRSLQPLGLYFRTWGTSSHAVYEISHNLQFLSLICPSQDWVCWALSETQATSSL